MKGAVRRWAMRVRGWRAGEAAEADLAAELDSHIDLHVRDQVRTGASPEEARRQAILALGGVEATKERYRDQRGLPALDAWIRDVRVGLRALCKSPGFTAGAVIVLALGIGANTTIFSLVHAVLLRPLPYPRPERLVSVWHRPPQAAFPGLARFSVSPANYFDWAAESRSFDGLAIRQFRSLNLTGTAEPETLKAQAASVNFFDLIGVPPALGRTFTRDDDVEGASQVVVLSDGVWKRRFGADPGVIGRAIRLNGRPHTVVGVMPASFHFPDWADVWTPLGWTADERAVRSNHNCTVVGRLRDGVDLDEAQAEMSTIADRLAREYPDDNTGWGAVVVPLHENLVEDVRPTLLVLLGAVAFVLLIASANVANLVLARTLARRKEIALRLALGAGRPHVLRQVLCETTLLGLAGGALGLLLAANGLPLIVAVLGADLPHDADPRLSGWVLFVSLAVSLATGVLAGLAPAWRLTRVNVAEALKLGLGPTDGDAGGTRTRVALVVAEVALSLVLLVGAGLMIRSLWLLRSVDTGFDSQNVVAFSLMLPEATYAKDEERARLQAALLQRVRAVPGVVSAGVGDSLPSDGNMSHWPIAIEGRPILPAAEQPQVQAVTVSPGFLESLRVPVLRGRDFDDHDTLGRPDVALVSQAMARHYWPGEDAVGRRLTTVFLPGRPIEVVGIVKDVKLQGLDVIEAIDAMYLPYAQVPPMGLELVVRAGSSPGAIVPAVVGAIHDIDPDQPVMMVRPLDDVLQLSLARKRFTMLLLGAFAGVALVLAAVGIYSVLSYTVRRRVREIGIRLALGGRLIDVVWMVVLDGLKPTLLGIAIGVVAALGLSRALASLTFGVTSTDPLTFAAVSALLVGVGALASLVPAYRATQVDPIKTLRDD